MPICVHFWPQFGGCPRGPILGIKMEEGRYKKIETFIKKIFHSKCIQN
jgi:hypothetical protein